jgi:hypothetical protein
MKGLGAQLKARANALEIELGLTRATVMERASTRIGQLASKIGL